MVRRTKSQIEKRNKAIEMLKSGASMEDIMRETKLSYQQITGLKGYLKRLEMGKPPKPPKPKPQRLGESMSQKVEGLSKGDSTEKPLGESEGKPEVLGSGDGEPPAPSSGTQDKYNNGMGGASPLGQAADIFEREIWVKATPIIRKVVLNPVVYLYYDYVRENYGYEGDLGDFIYDCVQDFFRSRGIKIKVVKEEEVA